MKKAHILYGFSEGCWNSQRFRRALQAADITYTNDISDADYVIAHSGGCYYLPELRNDQLVVLINPTYWPGKTLIERANGVFLQNFRELTAGRERFYHVLKFFHFLWILVWRARRHYGMYLRAKTFDLSKDLVHERTIIIRNHGDPWLTPDTSALKKANPKLQVYELDGYHDDCWLNPEPYITIIRQRA